VVAIGTEESSNYEEVDNLMEGVYDETDEEHYWWY